MDHRIAFRDLAVGFLSAAASFAASAFPLNPGQTIVEFTNDVTGHYVLLSNADEIHGVETGAAGAGWRRTGFQFSGYWDANYGKPVCRFYTYGANSHFFTADAAECGDLKRDGRGWIFEKIDFNIDVPVSGSCGAMKPVWRFYNNRWMYNDSNHRFTADAGEAAKMRARGWIDEGIAFCTQWAQEVPAQSYVIGTSKIRPSPECEDPSINVGPCIALNQQPLLPNRIEPFFPPWYVERNPLYLDAFTSMTGTMADLYTAQPVQDAAAVAAHSFVQAFPNGSSALGLFVNAADRTVGNYTSINPLFQFFTDAPAAGQVDPRVFPWRDAGPNELVLTFDLAVKTIARGDASSQAYGHPTLEFIDATSGEHLYVTLQTYGTMDSGDFVAIDTTTGRVIVSTSFRPDPMFGKRYEGQYIRCQADSAGGTCATSGTSFRFGIDREAFAKVLSMARTANGRLSAEPGHYLLRNFHFNNEVYREGRIGLSLQGYRLEIFDR